MRVVVLAHNLRVGGGKNVGVNVVRELMERRGEDDFLFLLPTLDEYKGLEPSDNGTAKCIYLDHEHGLLDRIFFEWIEIPRYIRDYKPAAILGLGNRGVLSDRSIRQAILVHNAHLAYPETVFPTTTAAERLFLWLKRRHLRRVLPSVDVLCVQTEVMEKRLRYTYDFSGDVHLVPNVLPPSVRALANQSSQRSPRASGDEGAVSFLCLNRYYPHKGIELLVEAFAHLRTEFSHTRLLLTIERDDHPGARRLLDRLLPESESGVRNLGRIDSDSLPEVYAKTDVVVLPSHLESFSANYLEAMATRKPILTSDMDFAHAVCGSAALYFKPGSSEALARAMRRVIMDSQLRDVLAVRGRERLGELGQQSWAGVAESLLQAVRPE